MDPKVAQRIFGLWLIAVSWCGAGASPVALMRGWQRCGRPIQAMIRAGWRIWRKSRRLWRKKSTFWREKKMIDYEAIRESYARGFKNSYLLLEEALQEAAQSFSDDRDLGRSARVIAAAVRAGKKERIKGFDFFEDD